MSVHNGEPYTSEAINSILGQTLTDWEFLIVDDASTDGTLTILKDYASSDSRIKILTNTNNIGLTKSLNLAILQARVEFIARQDADDISAPNRLKKQFNYMQTHPNIAVLGCLDSSFNEYGIIQTATDNKLSPAQIKQYLRRGNLFTHGSVMIRKSCLEQVGLYREFFRYSQDYDLWLRMSQYFDLAIMPNLLYQHRMTPQAISVSQRRTQRKYAEIAKKMHAERLSRGTDSYDQIVLSYPNGLPNCDSKDDKYNYHIFMAGEFIHMREYRNAWKELCDAWKLGCWKWEVYYLFVKSLLNNNLLNIYRKLRDREFKKPE